LGWAEIGDRQIEPPLHLTIGVLGKADRAGRANAFESCRDIDAVAHEVAVRLLDDVAEVAADAELDAPFRRDSRVALDHSVLHLDRAPDRVHYAAELSDVAVARALDDARMMRVDCGVRSVRSPRGRDSVRSSSVPASRL
jgi:hypothetical protein